MLIGMHRGEFNLNVLVIDIIKEYEENSINLGYFGFVFDGSESYICFMPIKI